MTTNSGCPVTDVVLEQPDHPGYDERCASRNARLLTWLAAEPAGTVVLAGSNEFWLRADVGVEQAGAWVRDPDEKAALYEASMVRVVQRLEAVGHRVILMRGIPHFVDDYAWDVSQCSLTELRDGCVQTMPLGWALQRAAAVDGALAAVVARSDAVLLDVVPDICPAGTCRTWRDELPVYRDGTHITVAMSKALAPRFVAAL